MPETTLLYRQNLPRFEVLNGVMYDLSGKAHIPSLMQHLALNQRWEADIIHLSEEASWGDTSANVAIAWAAIG